MCKVIIEGDYNPLKVVKEKLKRKMSHTHDDGKLVL